MTNIWWTNDSQLMRDSSTWRLRLRCCIIAICAVLSSTLGGPQSTLLYTPSSPKGEKGHSRERGARNRMNSVGGPSGVIHMSPGTTKHSEFQLHCSPWSPHPHPLLLQTNGCALVRKVSVCVCVEQRSRPPAAFRPPIQKRGKITTYCKCYSVVISCFLFVLTNTVLLFWFSLMHLWLSRAFFHLPQPLKRGLQWWMFSWTYATVHEEHSTCL